MMSDKTNSLGSVYSGMNQEELMGLINQARASTASPEQQETARRIDEELDSGGVMRSRFQRPAPTAPAPAPVSKGLTATPQVQAQEDTSMLNLNSIKNYLSNLFSSSTTSTPPPSTDALEQRAVRPSRYSEKYSANNPGNVERLKNDLRAGENKEGGYGDNNRFPTFDHPVMGLRAIFMDMNKKVTRHDGNLKKMISEYAPKTENKTKKYYDFVKNKLGKEKINSKPDIRKVVEAIVEYENKEIDDGKLVNFYLSPQYGFMDEAEQLAKLNLPEGLSYERIAAGDYSVIPKKRQVAQRASGGRIAKNPNPYTPKAI
tara:strand:- start:77 stop:1024 length:948 start_codon:yes stop_codon:yes gene_type:complete